MGLSIMVIIIIATTLLGFPLFFSFLLGCIAFFVSTPGLDVMMLPTKMVSAMNSFPFLAIPFFILAGQIMNRGGITRRIFKFADTLVGRFHGGLGYVNILASFIFSGMSGSALADIGGLGVIEIDAMKKAGYDEKFSVGITAASSTIGPIVPPSLPFVSYALFANVSLGTLFLAGFTPGVIMVVVLSIMNYYFAKKRNYPVGDCYKIREIGSAFLDSFWALLSPVILIGSIWFGWVTPTEAAFICVVYSFFVGIVIYKDIRIREIPQIMIDGFKAMAPCLSIVLVTVVMGFIFNYVGLNKIIYSFVSGITTNKYFFLLLVNIFLLIIGMILDPSASMVVLVPILAPVAQMYGINLIHFGVILCLNLMIGLLTPPVGMSLYLLVTTTGRPFKYIVSAILPWLLPLFISLILVTYLEGLVMFVPNLLGM